LVTPDGDYMDRLMAIIWKSLLVMPDGDYMALYVLSFIVQVAVTLSLLCIVEYLQRARSHILFKLCILNLLSSFVPGC
jgi:hypothetical protein